MNKLLKVYLRTCKDGILQAELNNCKSFKQFCNFCCRLDSGLSEDEIVKATIDLLGLEAEENVEDKLDKVSGGKMNNRLIAGVLGALSAISIAIPNTSVSALSPNTTSVVEKAIRSQEDIKFDSVKSIYEYFKSYEDNFNESELVELINDIISPYTSATTPVEQQNPIYLFGQDIKKLVSEGKTEFEAISETYEKFIKQYGFDGTKIFKTLFFRFLNKNFSESVNHLTKDGKGIAIVRTCAKIPVEAISELPKYDSKNPYAIDFRHKNLSKLDLREYENLKYASFDSATVWPPKDKLPDWFNPEKILEEGKNPGLGINALHSGGIDGNGVGLAIIDQLLLSTHEDYKDNLKLYEEMAINRLKGTDDVLRGPDMHGPAVASIAVGKNCGVAPKSDLYFIGTDCNSTDTMCKDNIKQIDRILELNKTLPENKKIRVISISKGYGEVEKDYAEFVAKIEEAKKQGVFVITTTVNSEHKFGIDVKGLSRSGDVDKSSNYSFGESWDEEKYNCDDNYLKTPTLFIPMNNRTHAGFAGDKEYQHDFEGGSSWMVPWLAGCYALCCQVKPDITPELFMKTAFETGDILNNTSKNTRRDKNNAKVINPERLIEKLKSM